MVRETRYLIVRNLPQDCTEEAVIEHFQRYGKVQSVKLQTAKDNNTDSTATVAFSDIISAAKAHYATNCIGEMTLKTDYWEGSTGTPALARTPVVGNNTTQYAVYTSTTPASSRLVPTFSNWTKGSGGYFELHGTTTSTRSLEAARSESEVAAALASFSTVTPSQIAPTSSASSINNGHTVGLNPIIISERSRSRSVASPSSQDSGVKKSNSHLRSVSRSRSRSRGSRSSSSRSHSSGTHQSTSPHRSHTSSTTQPQLMIRSSRLVSSEVNESKRDDSKKRRNLGICLTGLPIGSTDSNLRAGLYHEYRKHGMITNVKFRGDGENRCVIIIFKKPEDAFKALKASHGKTFFGAKIRVVLHESVEVDDTDQGIDISSLDEYHVKSTRTLFIGNLSSMITRQDLIHKLKQFGEIIDVEIKKQRARTIIAFVEYADILSVVSALRGMKGEHIGDSKTKLDFRRSIPTDCVWLDCLPTDASDCLLRSTMDRFGEIVNCYVDRLRNKALVYFSNCEDAQHCVSDIKSSPDFLKKKLQIDFASRECQNDFFERMERTNQLRAHEWPDDINRVHSHTSSTTLSQSMIGSSKLVSSEVKKAKRDDNEERRNLGICVTGLPIRCTEVDDTDQGIDIDSVDEYHVKSTRTLFVGNLENKTTKQDLIEKFEQFGEIIDVDIKKQGANTFAFLQYVDSLSVVSALRGMKGEHIGDNQIKLDFGKSLPTDCVWLDCIPSDVTDCLLRSTMARFGEVVYCYVDRLRNKALVYFSNCEDAQDCVSDIKTSPDFLKKKLQVDFASSECQNDFFERMEKTNQLSANERPDATNRVYRFPHRLSFNGFQDDGHTSLTTLSQSMIGSSRLVSSEVKKAKRDDNERRNLKICVTGLPIRCAEVDDTDQDIDIDSLDEYHVKSSRTLFVGNLKKETTKQDLIDKFKQFGEIIDVDIKRRKAKSSFAFVQYADILSVVSALREIKKKHIGINKIKLGFGKSIPTDCVWLDCLPTDVTDCLLRSTMDRFGEIVNCYVDRLRNKGLVYFSNCEDAQHCVSDIKSSPDFLKKKLQVDFASRECQNDFFERMERTNQLRANERPDDTNRVHGFRQQQTFDGFQDDGHTSSTTLSQSMIGSSRLVSSEVKESKRDDNKERRNLKICVTGLPIRFTDSSLRDGLYHEYKKQGKVTAVQIYGEGKNRCGIVSFQKLENAIKALKAFHDKTFFGAKIRVVFHESVEVDDTDQGIDIDSLDEYHVKSTRTLFVGNLEKWTTKQDLMDKFKQFGEIIDVDIKKQGAKTFAFLQYADILSVVSALRGMKGKHIGDNQIKLDFGKSMPTDCVWLDCIPSDVSDCLLRSTLAMFWEVVNCYVDRLRNKALVYFSNCEDAQHCISDIKTSPHFLNQKLQIDFASHECQNDFFERMERTNQLNANERLDATNRIHRFQQQQSFDGFQDDGSGVCLECHGATTSTPSLEAARSESEVAAAVASSSAITPSQTAPTSSASSINNESTAGIIVSDTKEVGGRDSKEGHRRSSKRSRPHSVVPSSSRHSGVKKSNSHLRSVSRSRSRSRVSRSNSSRRHSSGTHQSTSRHRRSVSRSRSRVSRSSSSRRHSSGTRQSTSRHRSHTSSTTLSQSMIGSSRLVSSKVKESKRDDNKELRNLKICVTGLPIRCTDSSLRDGLYHEYKNHGKVTTVKICGDGENRCGIVSFQKPEDAIKALEASHDKTFFGAKIRVVFHESVDQGNDFDSLDEYHVKSTRTLFVCNLKKETTKQDLIDKFEQFGEIIDVDIKKQGDKNIIAFVEYADILSVVSALRGMKGKHIGDNKIKLGFGKGMPTDCVWLDRLPSDASDCLLRSTMARFGEVVNCYVDILRNKGLVYFSNCEDAQHCVSDVKTRPDFLNQKLQVDFASHACQNDFFERMEKTNQLMANERPDSTNRVYRFRQQLSFDSFQDDGMECLGLQPQV